MYSERERTAHVVRRLGIGANPRHVEESESVEVAIARMTDLAFFSAQPRELVPPASWDDVDYEVLWTELVPWWFELIASGEQPLVERLTWFWHDHFAVGGSKVDNSYILWQHHELIRRHATGNFAEMLRAVAKDAAMLWYLDGTENSVDAPNENFGREVMELHTVGIGNYTQADVRDIARAFTGWVINEPHWEETGFLYEDAAPWTGVLDPERFDSGSKTVLGTTGNLDMDSVIDLLLEHPATGRHVASSLFRDLVGHDPLPATAQRLGKRFAESYEILPLVEEIVADSAFVADDAIRAKIRTPLEKAATVLQGLPRAADADIGSLYWMLDKLHYLPLHPPNPAGFPHGEALLDPARLLGGFEMLYLVQNLDDEGVGSIDPFEALGLYDVSTETRNLIDRFTRPGLRLGLAFGSPEFMVV